jgi:signal transduction histidine kinase
VPRNSITLQVPTAEEAPLQAELDEALVRELLFRTRGASVALLAAEALVWLFVRAQTGTLVLALFVALVGITLLRLAGAIWISRRSQQTFQYMRAFYWFGAMSGLIGLNLGAIIVASFPHLPPLAIAMCVVAVTGINAGALLSLASSPPIYLLYVGFINAAVTFIAFAHPLPGLERTFQVMQVVYWVAIVAMMRSVHASLHGNILLRLRLAASLRELGHTQARLVDASRQAGRADVATELLHSVGNVLNSVNVSASRASEIVARSRTNHLAKFAAMITAHRDDLATFFRDDERGQKLPAYFTQLAEIVERDNQEITAELRSLTQNIDNINVIVSSRRLQVKPSHVADIVDVHSLIDDALALVAAACHKQEIEVVRDFERLPAMTMDRHKALQILVHVLTNACDAVLSNQRGQRRIIVRTRRGADGELKIAVEDNGCGVPAQDLARIFQLGFTTKPGGGGASLHYGACAARELKGNLTARSDGAGRGAAFVLSLPFCAAEPPP